MVQKSHGYLVVGVDVVWRYPEVLEQLGICLGMEASVTKSTCSHNVLVSSISWPSQYSHYLYAISHYGT